MTLCMLRFWLASAAVFAVLAMAGCGRQAGSTVPVTPTSGLAETPPDKGERSAGGSATETAGEIPTINAMELTQALIKDEEAGKRYGGKVVRIEGIVESVNLKPDGRDPGDAEVKLLGATYDLDKDEHWTVDCTLIDKPGANKLGAGQKVTLQGTYLMPAGKQVVVVKTTVVTAGPVAITQAEIERRRKEEPKAVAALEKLGVKCGKSGFGNPNYEIDLTDEQLTATGEIKPEVLAPMTKLVEIYKLSLNETRISDAGLAGLKKLFHLNTLNVYRTKIGDAGLAHLKDVPGLRSLELNTHYADNSLITDAGLAHLKGMKNLYSIELAKAQVTDAGLASLADLRNLTFLMFPNTQINGTGLKHLKGLRKLEWLKLSGCPVGDTGLEALAMLPKLTDLDLSGTKVDNAGMASLAKSPSLRTLNLCNTAVGDVGLEHLAKLKTLKNLGLSEKSKATPEGIKKLKAALPELTVGLEK